jgi:hypothetical protein
VIYKEKSQPQVRLGSDGCLRVVTGNSFQARDFLNEFLFSLRFLRSLPPAAVRREKKEKEKTGPSEEMKMQSPFLLFSPISDIAELPFSHHCKNLEDRILPPVMLSLPAHETRGRTPFGSLRVKAT